MLSVTEALRAAKAAAQASFLILLGLSVAFDTMNHHILPSVQSDMDISGKVLSWCYSFLTRRYFNVSWQGKTSLSHPLPTGVPQGSMSRPLVIAIYTTLLGQIIHSLCFSYHFYADDAQLYLRFLTDDTTVLTVISGNLSVEFDDQVMPLFTSQLTTQKMGY